MRCRATADAMVDTGSAAILGIPGRRRRRRTRGAACALTLLAALPLLLAAGCREVRVTGKVAVKGSEPHTWIALTTAGGEEYRLTGELAVTIANRLQGRTVTVEARIVRRSAGPGLPAELEVVRLVSPALPAARRADEPRAREPPEGR